jgi:uncharacterized membrane-anchored protein
VRETVGPRAGGMLARVRVDARTKELVKRLRRGEIAVIDHEDLDATAAQALVECRPGAVINRARSMTGRYPNGGPAVLLASGIPLYDAGEGDDLAGLREGEMVELGEGTLLRDGRPIAALRQLNDAGVREQLAAASRNLEEELRRFSENTLRYIAAERGFVTADLPIPPLKTPLRGRPALIVARGEGYKQDLAAIRAYIQNARPAIIGVDGGADALLEAGYRPDLIVGDMDSATDAALRCGAELIVHAYADGRPGPGWERVQRLGLTAQLLPALGTSEDVAMLLAYQAGAALLVAVGTRFSLVEFLEKRRSGMASTFLTRLKVGSLLVDAKGVSRLYQPAFSSRHLLLLVLSACLPVLAIAVHAPAFQRWLAVTRLVIELWLRKVGLG